MFREFEVQSLQESRRKCVFGRDERRFNIHYKKGNICELEACEFRTYKFLAYRVKEVVSI